MSTKSIQNSSDYQKVLLKDNLQYFRANHIKRQKTFAEEIALSLRNRSKSINPKYFYNEKKPELMFECCPHKMVCVL